MNTSLPKVNVNFALCHEIYHVCFQDKKRNCKIELLNQGYYDNAEEYFANSFAGMLMMPENNFKNIFRKLRTDDRYSELEIIAKLMNYFETPYMATLIRCYELKLLDGGELLEQLLQVQMADVQNTFKHLWLDDSILDATKRDDYKRFDCLVEEQGNMYLELDYIDAGSVRKALDNMRVSYKRLRGE